MGEVTVRETVIINNKQGLHARPADLFVKYAQQFKAKIDVIKDGERVDGKSILGILTLAAMKGTSLLIEATGHDAEEALAALVELINRGFAEEEISQGQETGENVQPG